MTAVAWLADELERIDAAYPIVVPDGMTVRCIPHTTMNHITSWAIEIAMANPTRQATCHISRLHDDVALLHSTPGGCTWQFHPRAQRQRSKAPKSVRLDLPFYAPAQDIVDAVAAWVNDTGELDLGATA